MTKPRKPSAASVSKLDRAERIRQESLAAKKLGVDPPWQIARGDRFRASRADLLPSPDPRLRAGGVLAAAVAEQDRDFLFSGYRDSGFDLASVLAKKLTMKEKQAVANQVRDLFHMLTINDSDTTRRTLGERIMQLSQLGMERRQVRSMTKKLDALKFKSARKYTNARGVKGGGFSD